MHCAVVIITDFFFPGAELSVDQQQGLIQSTRKTFFSTTLIVLNLNFWVGDARTLAKG